MDTEKCQCNLCDMIEHTTWISVEDRLPNNFEKVLAYHELYEQIYIASFFEHDGWQSWENENWVDIENVSAWMPLPKAPKEK